MPPVIAAAPPAADLYSLPGKIEPTRLTVAYRAGLVVVAIAMMILPLVYLGLILSAAGAVWWHLTENSWIVTSSSGGGIWRLLAYLGPAVAGSVLVFFMVKPVLARPAKRVDPVPIQPGAEPELFRFVTQVCDQVDAPRPSRIQVDCQVNASASFTSVLALVRPRFVLTIGLPLVAGLTIRQLGGVLAHEFGHFAQSGGMRLTFIVRSINAWFARVVGERDQWDEKLARWAKEADWRISIVLLLAQGSVWCSRRILHGLMLAGHGISCFMLRQMEYDADSYEVKLAGSSAFGETSARLRELNVAAQLGYHELQEGWVRRTLPANLPTFMMNQCTRIPQEVAQRVRQLPDAKTRLFDTHPADADRVRAAELAAAPGILQGGDLPATLLFRDFEGVSVAATRHHYQHDLDLSLDSTTLVDTAVAVAASENRYKNYQAIEAFLGSNTSVLRPIHSRMPGVESLATNELVQRLREAKESIAQLDGKAYRDYEEFDRKLTLAECAQALFEAGFTKVAEQDFELANNSKAAADEAVGYAGMQLQRLEPSLRRIDDIVAGRFACAVALLERSAQSDPRRETLRREAARLNPVLLALADAWPGLNHVRRLHTIGGLLNANAASSPDPDAANAKLTATVDWMRSHLEKVRKAIGDTPTPDDDASHGNRLASLLGLESTIDVEVKAVGVVNAAIGVRADVVGRLCRIALAVEESQDT